MNLWRTSGGVDLDGVTQENDGSIEGETAQEVDEVVQEDSRERADEPAVSGRRPSLSTLLTAAGIASEEQIRAALEEGDRTGEKLGEVVVRRGWASEGQFAQILAQQWGLKAVDPGSLSLDPLAVSRVEISRASELGGVPVWFDQHGIVVAVSEPNEERFASFGELLGNVSFVVVPRSTLKELVESRIFGSQRHAASPGPFELNDTSTVTALAASTLNGDGDGSGTQGDPDDHVPEDSDAARNDLSVTVSASQDGSASPPAAGALAELLGSIGVEAQALEQALGEARGKVAAQESEMSGLREAHVQALDRVRELEAELVERERRFQTLREKVADLSLALD